VVDEQVVIERVGMIEVSKLAIVQRQILEITVIGILLNEDNFARPNGFQDAVCYRSLTRSGPAGNANN